MPSYDRALWALRTWLDSWSGIGHIAVRMHRQGYDRQLTQYDERGGRATFYTTGMEHSPIVRLDPGTTKNLEGRTFVITPELRATLEAQRQTTEALQRKAGSVIPWVSHRTKRGRPLK